MDIENAKETMKENEAEQGFVDAVGENPFAKSEPEKTEITENEAGQAAKETEQKEVNEIPIKFGKGLVSEPFQAKDGNEYVRISIPNTDENDKSPWASFVAREKNVHENQYGKGMWLKVPENGYTTVTKPVYFGKNEVGDNIWKDTKVKISNKELKKMVEAYKERTSLKEKMEEKKGQVAEQKKAAVPEKASDKKMENAL